ncbi:MAG: HAMP domain-containing histidine kinase [Magnetospirillum sp. WYHS-4]
MRTAVSLQVRLLAGALVWILAALAVAGLLLTDLFRRHVEAQFHAALEIHLNELAAALHVHPDGKPSLRRPPGDPVFHKPYSGAYWQVSAVDGRALLRSRSLWDDVIPLAPDAILDGEVHSHRLPGPQGQGLIVAERAVVPADGTAVLRLVVARDGAVLADAVRAFATTLAASLTVLAVGLALAAVLQVRLGLRPLDRLRQALSVLRTDNGTPRLEGEYPSEVKPLVDELNALVEHRETLVERARVQAGNLAHALKTPLAVMTNEAGRLGEGGEVFREQLELARRQVEVHLARARAAAAGASGGQKFAATASIRGLRAVMVRAHAGRDLRIDVDADEGLLLRGERQDFEEMLGNLMDNACKWAAQRVRVAARIEAGRCLVAVDDDGPGLPEERREEVFGRGRRLDEAAPGSGLGLAIVRDLAETMGGTVRLEGSPLGGLRAVLDLPSGDIGKH